MKTVFIPSGATYRYETLVADYVIVHGHLYVEHGLKAKQISGKGFVTAGEVSADVVDVYELEGSTVICCRLLAQRVSVQEALISEAAVVSRFFSASYVKAPSLSIAVSEIGEADAEQIVHLKPNTHGIFFTLLAARLRALRLRLTVFRPQGKFEQKRTEIQTEAAGESAEDAALKADIAKVVQEVLSQQTEEKKADAEDADDFELRRVVSTFRLLREQGYTLRVIPGTPEENAPTFDFAAESGLCAA